MSAATDRAWMDDAACRDHPVRRFTDPAGPDDVHQARRTCLTCPVREPCLNVALARPAYADPGIWGGTTPAQRRHIRNGRLALTEALDGQEAPHRPGSPRSAQPPLPPPDQHDPKSAERSQRRPRLAVSRDRHGDYLDESGRVFIFRIFGEPPYMLMIDHRPVARTTTVREAAEQAWDHLHSRNRTDCRSPEDGRREPHDRTSGSAVPAVSPSDKRPVLDSLSRRPRSGPTSTSRLERTGRGR